MKLVVNTNWGGFSLPEQFAKAKDVDIYTHKIERSDPDLVAYVEKDEYNDIDCLGIAEIPDEATDYYISDYDGIETVIYVLDGKIHFAEGETADDE